MRKHRRNHREGRPFDRKLSQEVFRIQQILENIQNGSSPEEIDAALKPYREKSHRQPPAKPQELVLDTPTDGTKEANPRNPFFNSEYGRKNFFGTPSKVEEGIKMGQPWTEVMELVRQGPVTDKRLLYPGRRERR